MTSAAGLGASDLHLADGEPPCVRVDGALQRLDLVGGVDVAATLGLGDAERARLARGDSIDRASDVAGVGRVRIHVFQSSEGLAAAIRLLPRAAPSLASLHMPLPLDELAELPHGLVLVCGATGSGKSTTLAALAQEALRRRSIVLTTLEDPIEYALSPPETSLVRRRQVGRDVRDFATGLRDALREDPDVLLVGEMRDRETISLALTAAETGHLVLSSLHSRSAASAIERIVDSYPAEGQGQIRAQLADSLRAIVVQRLVPRARGEGRLPVIEVLRVTHAVGSLIREAKTAQVASTLQAGKREGMLSLERCLADRVQAGEVRLEDARAVANEPGVARVVPGKVSAPHPSIAPTRRYTASTSGPSRSRAKRRVAVRRASAPSRARRAGSPTRPRIASASAPASRGFTASESTAVHAQLRGSPLARDDHRLSARHPLGDRPPERLGAGARVDDDVERAVGVLRPRLERHETGDPLEPQLPDACL